MAYPTPEQIRALRHKYNRAKRDPSQLQMYVDELLEIVAGTQDEIDGIEATIEGQTLSYAETMAILEG